MNAGVPEVERVITQERIDAYAAASGDRNPIHIDPAFARDTPFGGTIAHGMLVLALIGDMMHAAFDRRWLETGRLKVRFKAPTRPGETVRASALYVKGDGDRREYAVQCENERGDVLIEGRASVAGA